MNVANVLAKKAILEIDQQVEIPVLLMMATILSKERDSEESRLVLMTPYSLYLFDADGDDVNLRDVLHFYNIESIKENKGRYRIKFKTRSLIFIGDTACAIAKMAVCQTMNIFTENELFNFSENLLPKENYFPSPRTRFVAKLIAKGNVPPADKLNECINHISSISSHFDIGKVEGISDYLSCVLFAILIARCITHLTIPSVGNSHFWDDLIDFIGTNSNIRWLTISNNPEPIDDFRSFCEFVREGGCDGLHILEFKDVMFTEKTLNYLFMASSTNNLETLIFNHCGFDMTEKMLNRTLGAIRKRTRITRVGFFTWNFDKRDELLNSMFTLNRLHLMGCDIELSKLLSVASKTMCSELNFSSNPATTPLSSNLSFSEHLTRLSLNNIKWTGTMLTTIVSLATKTKEPFALHIANAEIKESDKIVFDNALAKMKAGNLESFVWSGNYLTNNITKFMMSGKINFLGLAGIRFDSNYNFLSSLKCEYLDIHGTKRKLGNDVVPVLNALSKSSVTFVDISHNDFGLYNIKEVAKAIEKYPKLRCINIDDNNVINAFAIKEFGQKFFNNKKLFIFYPWQDIYKIYKNTLASSALESNKYFHVPKSRRQGSLSADDWQATIDGFYPENNISEDVDSIPPIDCPNSDYYPDDDDDDNDENDSSEDIDNDIWKFDILTPPSNVIESINEMVQSTHSIQNLVRNIECFNQ